MAGKWWRAEPRVSPLSGKSQNLLYYYCFHLKMIDYRINNTIQQVAIIIQNCTKNTLKLQYFNGISK